MMETKIKADLEFLLTKAYQLFLEDQIFHLMENSFYFQLVSGKELLNLHLNIVLFFIERIS